MNAIVISATAGEQIRVERIVDNVVVEKYMTTDLKKPPKRMSHYIAQMLPVIGQERANITVEIPPVPPLEPTALERAENALVTSKFALAVAHIDGHLASCEACMSSAIGVCDEAIQLMQGIPRAHSEERLLEPDRNCITLPNGDCVGGLASGKEPCMHDEVTNDNPNG